MSSTDPSAEVMSERTAVYLKRYKEARMSGLTIVEARLFAESEIDVSELRVLVGLRCPPQLIAKIVL